MWVRQFYIRSGKAHPPVHIEICAGGWNAGDGPTGKQDVELFFSGVLSESLYPFTKDWIINPVFTVLTD